MLRLFIPLSLFVIPEALRSETTKPKNQQPEGFADTDNEQVPEDEETWIVCRQCRQRLTRPSERAVINGSHQHTFANPSGIVFEIGCFAQVRGCSTHGPPSNDFAWFAGHSWQIIICAKCLTHLGWMFASNQGQRFYGLITDRISAASGPKEKKG